MSVLDAEIERLSRRRQEIWAGAPESQAGEAARIGRSLSGLFEEKRREDATEGGSPAEIARRARIEAELERLMSS